MLKPYQKAELTFDILKEIGQDGRNSRTYVTRDHQLNAEIVTKQIQKNSLNSTDEFFAESQSLYASAHPHVVQIHYAAMTTIMSMWRCHITGMARSRISSPDDT